jgi:UDP-N-acetylmuramoyl-L-alanyl-D-glutamate--2,6-diaminopimelate ligase
LRLIEILEATKDVMQTQTKRDGIEITGLTADSRQVRDGYLFAALQGANTDGRRFIGEALSNGAAAILAPEGTPVPEDASDRIALITAANPRRALARLAAAFYEKQPASIAAVTGTSGKTSVADFCRQIWSLQDIAAASLGTLGLVPPRDCAPKSLTTPDPVELHACLADLAQDGIDHLVLEASSHGLDQFRLDGIAPRAALFTNLSQDHLDYHGSMASYLTSKSRLFAELLPPDGIAILNADSPESERLKSMCDSRALTVRTYGANGDSFKLLDQRPLAEGQTLTFEAEGRRVECTLPLIGTFQAENVLAALALATACDADLDRAIADLPRLRGVPGRMEYVGMSPGGGAVYVDYSHKPGALETVLKALRPHTNNDLWVLFGCGGDRDRGKRPQMGAIATRLAEHVIITDDNPRGEDPATIRNEILAAASQAREIGDRGEAIAEAVAELRPGDVLVIAGKGHERGQTVGGQTLPFDDRDVARAAVARGKSASSEEQRHD